MIASRTLDDCKPLQIGHAVDGAGTAYPSLRTLAQRTGLSRRTVIRAVQELEKDAVITRGTRWRKDGSRGSTVYSFNAAQWDLFLTRRGRGRRRKGGGDKVSPGGVAMSSDKGAYRSSLIGARNNSPSTTNGKGTPSDRCERTIDIEEEMKRQEQAINRALKLGYRGDLRPTSINAFLREHATDELRPDA